MKKILILTIMFSLLATPVMAQDIMVKVQGQYLMADTPPIIQNGKAMLPFRVIFEALGAQVTWDDKTKTATGSKDNVNISLQVNNPVAVVNGQNKQLDTPPAIINNRTFVPVRFIAENLGLPVEWDAASQLVTIGLDKLYSPDGKLMYEGQVKNGKLNGQGTLYKDNQIVYKGQFRDGAMDGQGELFTNGQSTFKGEFANNQIVQ